jgi:hypothetical protein
MKKVFLILILFVSLKSNSQTTERKKLFKSQYDYEIVQSIIEKDTSVYFAMPYQNEKYKQITDLGLIILNKKSDLKLFAEKLIEFSQKEKGTSIDFANPLFTISLYDFTDIMYLYDKNKKYKTLTKKMANKIANEILTKLDLLQD